MRWRLPFFCSIGMTMRECVIHCQTVYDESACRALVHLMLGKLRRWPRIALIALGILTALGAGMLMVMRGHVSALPFLMMILGSMVCMAGCFLEEISTRMLMAAHGKDFPVFTYEFDEEEIRIFYADRNVCYSYAYVLRLLEMSGYLFLFMKDGQAYILLKNGVKEGYGQLRQLLNTKCERPDARKKARH